MTEYFSDDDKRDLAVILRVRDKRGFRVPEAYTRHVLARRLSIPPWELDNAPQEVVEAEVAMMVAEREAEGYHRAKAERPLNYNLTLNTRAPYEPISGDSEALEVLSRQQP